MKAIASRDNPAFKAMARLASSGSERRRSGASVLDGAHLLAAFLDSGRKPESLMVSRAGLEDAEVARLVDRSRPAPVTLLSDPLFDALSTVASPTGVIAAVKTPLAEPVPDDAALALALDEIQDPGNVGTLLRSAAAAGARHALLSSGCAFAWSPKVLRAAMGAHFALNVVEGADLGAFLARYRGTSIALAGNAERSVYDLDLSGPIALVVGNEGSGVSPALEAAARVRARIPMVGSVESLNAGTAGSIALFEVVRQRTSGKIR
ncbi:MAG TPA: RNA methyltransferase [Usitatibacter sp.]|jgi:TrmH family RNA methyltransferase|nr:RNA methyltransferase [Usitatibacter sp.]